MIILSWNPLLAALFIFLFDFGAVFFLRTIFKRSNKYYSKFLTFWLGDSFFLPIYTFFVATILSSINLNKTYLVSPFWQVSLLFVGYTFLVISETLSMINKRRRLKDFREPGMVYHSLIFGPMFYLIIGPLPLVLSVDSHALAKFGALFCILAFGVLAVLDFLKPLVNRKV